MARIVQGVAWKSENMKTMLEATMIIPLREPTTGRTMKFVVKQGRSWPRSSCVHQLKLRLLDAYYGGMGVMDEVMQGVMTGMHVESSNIPANQLALGCAINKTRMHTIEVHRIRMQGRQRRSAKRMETL